jgi:DNA-directed RNA polymerase subunit RPC12/RpoP
MAKKQTKKLKKDIYCPACGKKIEVKGKHFCGF